MLKNFENKDDPSMRSKFRMGFFSEADDNQTPSDFLTELNGEFQFDFDPCPLGGANFMNGLDVEWGECNFVNPPYSDIEAWIKKALLEMEKGKLSVLLITARPNTAYWQNLIYPNASEIRYLHRGLKFGNHKAAFPMSLALVIFDPHVTPKYLNVRKNTYSYCKSL